MTERQVSFAFLEEGVQIFENLEGDIEVVYLSYSELNELLEGIEKRTSQPVEVQVQLTASSRW